jgi:hypothetical protein
MKMRKLRHYNKFSTVDKRCKESIWGCINCEDWKFFDNHGRFARSLDELTDWSYPFRDEEYR